MDKYPDDSEVEAVTEVVITMDEPNKHESEITISLASHDSKDHASLKRMIVKVVAALAEANNCGVNSGL